MPRKQNPPTPRRAVIRCTAPHLPVIQEILNDAILNTTALYEYAPRSAEAMREWPAVRVLDGIPEGGTAQVAWQFRQAAAGL